MAKPTIHELEEILSGGAGTVEILPDGSVVVSEELIALRADLKALAVTAKPIYDHLDRRIKGDVLSRLSVFVIGELGEALARDGVQEALDQATSRAAATTDD